MANEIGAWGQTGSGFTCFNGDANANVASGIYTAQAGDILTAVRMFAHASTGTGTAVVALYTVSAGLPNIKIADVATLSFSGFTNVQVDSGVLAQALPTPGVQYCLAVGKLSAGNSLSVAQLAQANGVSNDNGGGVHDLESPWQHSGYTQFLMMLAGDITHAAPPAASSPVSPRSIFILP